MTPAAHRPRAGIDPRHAARPGFHRLTGVGDLPKASVFTHAGNSNDSPITVNGKSDSDDALLIPRPANNDRQSIHFLVYEFVEFYVNRIAKFHGRRSGSSKKMFCHTL